MIDQEKAKARFKRHDARRIPHQSNKAKLWRDTHPEYDKLRRRRERESRGRGPHNLIDEIYAPLKFKSSNVIVAGDWHINRLDAELAHFMLEIAKDQGVKDIAIPGDFWEQGDYTSFVDLSWKDHFTQEKEAVAMWLQILVDSFRGVYFCQGNHEYRWINQNYGRMRMQELFATTEVVDGYEVTNDDHMILNPDKDPWLLCHPKNYRKTPGSVARELASIHHMNVCCAHGHQFSNNLDKSDRYRCIDGMGMFHLPSLEYARRTSCHSNVVSGFWLIQDGYPIEYRWSGKHGWADELGVKV